MPHNDHLTHHDATFRSGGGRGFTPLVALCAAGLIISISGCSILNRDLGAIPVNRVPRTLLEAEQKNDLEDISLLRLRRDKPEIHLLEPADILGVYIEGVLGDAQSLPPVNYPEDSSQPPAVGFPVPVREDGTISLPLIGPISVRGRSIVEATELIRQEYTGRRKLLPTKAGFIVTLIRPRTVRVLVMREESGGREGISKRGTGDVVQLPIGENDVLTALNMTGGLPGTDAKNEVVVIRGMFRDGVDHDQIIQNICSQSCQNMDPCFCDEREPPDPPNVTRIPLRYHPARPPVFSEQDIILQDGDIVVIRSRDEETYFTGGLLGGGEHPLPRDKDLDILAAIAVSGGQIGSIGTGVGGLGGGGGGGGGFGGVGRGGGGGGGGYCQPSQAIIVRELPCGNQITIKVDLNKALADRSTRILIKPNDIIILRYTLEEEIGNLVLGLFQFNYLLGNSRGGGF